MTTKISDELLEKLEATAAVEYQVQISGEFLHSIITELRKLRKAKKLTQEEK